MTHFKYTDGGRAAAGYSGGAGDCVVRAIAIATGLNYRDVYVALNGMMPKGRSPRLGVPRDVYQPFLERIGWVWVPVMKIGKGCTMHLRYDELPKGRIIARLSRHLVAAIDGVVHDTYDPGRQGTRCVYGYFKNGNEVTSLHETRLDATQQAAIDHSDVCVSCGNWTLGFYGHGKFCPNSM